MKSNPQNKIDLFFYKLVIRKGIGFCILIPCILTIKMNILTILEEAYSQVDDIKDSNDCTSNIEVLWCEQCNSFSNDELVSKIDIADKCDKPLIAAAISHVLANRIAKAETKKALLGAQNYVNMNSLNQSNDNNT